MAVQGYHRTAARRRPPGERCRKGQFLPLFPVERGPRVRDPRPAVRPVRGPDPGPHLRRSTRATRSPRSRRSSTRSWRPSAPGTASAAAPSATSPPSWPTPTRGSASGWPAGSSSGGSTWPRRSTRARALGVLAPDVDPEALARFLVAGIEGAILLTKVQRDIRVMEHCVAELRRHLGLYRRARAAAGGERGPMTTERGAGRVRRDAGPAAAPGSPRPGARAPWRRWSTATA